MILRKSSGAGPADRQIGPGFHPQRLQLVSNSRKKRNIHSFLLYLLTLKFVGFPPAARDQAEPEGGRPTQAKKMGREHMRSLGEQQPGV